MAWILAAVATLGGPAGATTSAVVDASGDAASWRWAFPHPQRARDLVFSGSTIEVETTSVPFGSPTAFYWIAATESVSTEIYDTVPEGPLPVAWASPATSSATGPTELALAGSRDLLAAEVAEPAAGRLRFSWEARQAATGDPDVFMFTRLDLPGCNAFIEVAPAAAYWFVGRPLACPYRLAEAWEDLVGGTVSATGPGELTFAATLAADLPAPPPATPWPFSPWIVWAIDGDGDAVNELNVVARWNVDTASWEGVLRQRTPAESFVDVAALAVARSGPQLAVVLRPGEGGVPTSFPRTFGWSVQIFSVVDFDGDAFQSGVRDRAPDGQAWASFSAAVAIPTLGPWGIAATTSLLALLGAGLLRRRRRTA